MRVLRYNEPQAGGVPMLDKEILVVDDDQDLRTMIRSVFESAGYTQITTAASGEEALALMAKKCPASSFWM